jgi:outer membrane lipoprotein-sorting protein
MSFARGWIPAIVAPAIVVATAVAVPVIANAASAPPPASPAHVLALVAGSHDARFSGTVQQTSDLGLPQLPSSMSSVGGGTDVASLIQLITGSHTARVYVDGETKQRVQLLDTLGERDVIHNGTSVWTYDADAHTATHLTVPTPTADKVRKNGRPGMPEGMPPTATPGDLADRVISSITPSTTVAVGTGTALGRGVYRLTLTPKSSETLVGDVVVTVDAETGVPLAVEVDARGQQTPAIDVAFTSIDFGTPSASTFDFTPPSGTTVTQSLPFATPRTPAPTPGAPRTRDVHAQPAVVGSGWSAIVELPMPSAGTASAPTPGTPGALGGPRVTPGAAAVTPGPGSTSDALLNGLTQRVAGGRMLETSLFTIYLRDDGTVYAGAVPPATLLAAATAR